MADGITDDVRRLEGAINKIAVCSEMMDEKITIESVKEWLKDLIN